MDKKTTQSFLLNSGSDKEIIKKILAEKESDAVVRDKMYGILFEVSLADDTIMDTDLIDECVKTIALIEGHEEHLSPEAIKTMRLKVDQKYTTGLRLA